MPRRPLPNPWTAAERKVLDRLRTPADVQRLLEKTAYSTEPIYRSPRAVLRDMRAHCFDGAMLAAAALERLGHEPQLVDLRAHRDDDHVLAVYRVGRDWGAIGKSNFVGLRGRDPVYRSLRELAMSYFEAYFNLDRERSLRSVSKPVKLRAFERLDWRTADVAMEAIAARLDQSPASSPRLARRGPQARARRPAHLGRPHGGDELRRCVQPQQEEGLRPCSAC